MTAVVACRFQDILVKYKYNGGEPITREFFDEHISGGHNILLSKFLWPDWSQEDRDAFSDEKEALFREYSRKPPARLPRRTHSVCRTRDRLSGCPPCVCCCTR